MALRTAFEWLGACSGCEIAFLNIGEKVVNLLNGEIEIVHAPLFMDHKYYPADGKQSDLSLPKADLGFVSGAVNNEEHLAVLTKMREQCDFLVALGTCATHGGIPALMNMRDQQQSWQDIFLVSNGEPIAASKTPDLHVPASLERVYACDEKVAIDLLLPGCAPNPEQIYGVIRGILDDKKQELPSRSVCDTCPVKREGKGALTRTKRCITNADYDEQLPLADMRCLLEQGFVCMGPVTLAGCAASGAPRCIQARVPCRGCFGPVRHGGNQMLDMMNAMASNNIDIKSVIDRRSLLRFTGAHGRLRHLKKGVR